MNEPEEQRVQNRVDQSDTSRDDGSICEFERTAEHDVSRKNEHDRSRHDCGETELLRRSDRGGQERDDAGDDDSVQGESVQRLTSKSEHRRRFEHSLEERRIEIVSRDDHLDEDEEGAERHGHEAVDERSVESWARQKC